MESRRRHVAAVSARSSATRSTCRTFVRLRYDLLFERFLDESRTEPPDIDIDFEKERRVEVIDYVKERYGSEMVCQIGTFGTLAARAAIKDTGRALGVPLARVNQITEMVPDELKITIKKALEKSADLKMEYDGDPEIRELLDLAMKIEGLARNVGTHAAAVVIADKPLTEYVPLGRVPGKQDVITQWSMGDVEASGLLKMDFLGLRNLTILSRTVQLIEQTTGKAVDPLKFPLDDKETYALLQRGETKGVFQLESGGIRDLLLRMKPDHFNDIIATAALYRPGPLEGGMVDDYVNIKHGRQQPEYKHPVLKEVLGRDQFDHGLPGTGDADPQPPRQDPACQRVHLHQGDQQEEGIADQPESRSLHPRFGRQRIGRERRRRHLESDRQVRGLRIQQITQHRLRAGCLSNRVPEGPLSRRIHGGVVVERYFRPQLQTQRCIGRTHGGLRSDGDRSRLSRCEFERPPISRSPTATFTLPFRRSKAVVGRRRSRSNRNAKRTDPSRTSSISANVLIRPPATRARSKR